MEAEDRARPTSTETAASHDRVWSALCSRQLPRVRAHACDEYLAGLERLPLPVARVPSLGELDASITPRTGWRTVRTRVRYTDADPWYRHFARREFLVTDYMRGWDELDFTPEPDMFHDIFGHLPFFTLPAYARLQELFAPAFLRAAPSRREEIKRVAWFSTEFGLVRQKGRLKALGAGLISGGAELDRAMAGEVAVEPFSVERVIAHEKAVWSHNRILFAAPSLAELHRELEGFLARLA